jgi:hypothetical protein
LHRAGFLLVGTLTNTAMLGFTIWWLKSKPPF